MLHVESPRPRIAPTAQNAPREKDAARRTRAKTFHTGRDKRSGCYHKSPNDATLQLCAPKRELEPFFHPPLLAANYINANICGVL